MIVVVLIGPISNSHVNPAVTLGVLVREMCEDRSKGMRCGNVLFAFCIMVF